MAWCPKFRYGSEKTKFKNKSCSQCGTTIETGEELNSDPFKNTETRTSKQRQPIKDFVFDQKVSSIKSIPTETLGLYTS